MAVPLGAAGREPLACHQRLVLLGWGSSAGKNLRVQHAQAQVAGPNESHSMQLPQLQPPKAPQHSLQHPQAGAPRHPPRRRAAHQRGHEQCSAMKELGELGHFLGQAAAAQRLRRAPATVMCVVEELGRGVG